MAFDISKLPPWALPLGVGGLVGVGVLMTRGGKSSGTLAPIPVGGQEPGETDTSIGMMLTQFFESFGKQNEQTLDTFTDLIAAQNAASATRDAAFADMIREFAESIETAIGAIELPSQPPNTNPPPNRPPNQPPPNTNPPPNQPPPNQPPGRKPIPRIPRPPRNTKPIPPRPIWIKPKSKPKPKGPWEISTPASVGRVDRNDDSTLDNKAVSGWH